MNNLTSRLTRKIKDTPFTIDPFDHVYIENFLPEEIFKEIINTTELNLEPEQTTEKLYKSLIENGYKEISFPGCTTSIKDYISWERGCKGFANVDTCEGFGMAFRLKQIHSSAMHDLHAAVSSRDFQHALQEKFNIETSHVKYDYGFQKYLNGYEISPHPDIRKKALTFMLNINPTRISEELNYHTSYLSFKDPYKYIQEFWKHNRNCDRCWVPWDWCNIKSRQVRNNSIVIFKPDCNTLHGVKASYNHLETQRTQLYGNIWYDSSFVDYKYYDELPVPPWQSLKINFNLDEKMRYKSINSRPETKLASIQRISLLLSKAANKVFAK